MMDKKQILIIISSLFLYFTISLFLAGCSGGKVKVDNTPRQNYTYFRIIADADDDPIFVKLQNDLNIDPKMERYSIVVNIRKDNPNPYILLGNVDDTSPLKYPWSQLSKEVQNGLINWTKDNKERLD